MSIRSSLLNQLILSLKSSNQCATRWLDEQGLGGEMFDRSCASARLQRAYCVFDLLRERGIVVAAQLQRRAEPDVHSPWTRHSPRWVQHAVDAFDTDWNDRNAEPCADHADAAAERTHLAAVGAFALGKDQNRPAVAGELADVLQGLPRAGLALRQRKRVEVERGQGREPG